MTMQGKTKNGYYTNRHSCYILQYHIVLVTKYKHPVLVGEVKDAVYGKIKEIAKSRKINILEMNGEADHLHLLLETPPQVSPGELVNVIKTQTSRYARKLYGDSLLKKYYWKPYFWTDSYFVASVSENTLETVQNYIKNQGIQ
jgi:putative transposase